MSAGSSLPALFFFALSSHLVPRLLVICTHVVPYLSSVFTPAVVKQRCFPLIWGEAPEEKAEEGSWTLWELEG